MVFLPLMLIWLRDPMYFNNPCRWAMVAFAASIGLLAPEIASQRHGGSVATAADSYRSGSSVPAESRASVPSPAASSLIREGTRWTGRVGQFSQSDGGWYFTAAQTESTTSQTTKSALDDNTENPVTQPRTSTSTRLRVLENLALQRVAQMIQQDPSDNRWMINGVVTEFFGENRLLIVLAVRAPIDEELKR